jgi:LacI family transcriptional regulator
MSLSGKRKVTIDDVAKKVGVGKTTVSSVLSGRGRVSPQRRAAILAAMVELGYEANYYAQRLKGGRDNVIGIFSTSLDLGVSTQQAQFLQFRIGERGYEVPLYALTRSTPDSEKYELDLATTLRRQKPLALICDGSSLRNLARDELQRFQEEGGVAVCYGRAVELDCDQVIFDEVDHTYQSIRYLLEQGHRDIAFSQHGDVYAHDLRADGLLRALGEWGLPLRCERLWAAYPYEAAGAQLADKFLQMKQRPSAISIINDVAASSFINHLLRAGLRVPHDVSVIGHDNTLAAEHCVVPLTTVSHPIEKIGLQVVEFLFERLQGHYSGPARRCVIRGELVVRDSVAKLNQ